MRIASVVWPGPLGLLFMHRNAHATGKTTASGFPPYHRPPNVIGWPLRYRHLHCRRSIAHNVSTNVTSFNCLPFFQLVYMCSQRRANIFGATTFMELCLRDELHRQALSWVSERHRPLTITSRTLHERHSRFNVLPSIFDHCAFKNPVLPGTDDNSI